MDGQKQDVHDKIAKQSPAICPGHTMAIVQLAFSQETPEGTFFVSACKDKVPMLRNADNGDWIGTFEGHKGAIWSCNLNTPATLVVTASADYTSKVFSAITGDLLHSFEHPHIVYSANFSHDGTRIATVCKKTIALFSLSDEDPYSTRRQIEIESMAKHLLFSLDDTKLICGGERFMFVVDIESGNTVTKLEFESNVTDIELVATKKILAVTTSNKIYFISAEDFKIIKSHDILFEAESASLHPTESRFVVGGSDTSIHVYDYDGGEELVMFKGHHHGGVHTVRFHPNGRSYASGSDDGTIRLWKDSSAF